MSRVENEVGGEMFFMTVLANLPATLQLIGAGLIAVVSGAVAAGVHWALSPAAR